ncbi:hypothetical protein A946_11610 [Methylacidiphilum kamchatkense Kam1]|uniref:Uncharacterized protein n=1 Tax=Methylacidiphilum kamchatkense Kam1 TaxID=1202785 RepID=A0A0C1RS44_9BACT|nr:hypothetical protein [Methylacidiphilum kamchatkense]KIE57736.1 hypothetical protein A946_11610 [Methylacidiphilum kamchatkense Kam1]QDQ42900.1 hypothetical protein kam1_1685 [Methylacidiphilum kamchatkense Kam1]
MNGGIESYPILKDIATYCGVKSYYESDNPYLWINLLKKKKSEDTFYCFIGRLMEWVYDKNQKDIGRVKIHFLPHAKYQLTELISQKQIGILYSDILSEKGINMRLNLKEVAIVRLKKIK